MKELSINNNNNVTLISKIVLAGIIASSIGLASVHANTVHADTTTTTPTTSVQTPSSNVQSDYSYPYVGLPSWQEIDEEGALAQQYNNALTAENANLAEVEAGEAPTNYSPITLSEPTTPTPETTNGNTLQPGDEVEYIDGNSYIITPTGQEYKQASSLPTWGLFDTLQDQIQSDQAAIENDKAEEAAYEQSSSVQPTNVAYNTAANQGSSYSPTNPSTSTNTTNASINGSNSNPSNNSITPVSSQSSSAPKSSSSAYPMTIFPQTGNKLNYGLTTLGIILAAIASGLTYVKVTGKKVFGTIFGNLHKLFTFSK